MTSPLPGDALVASTGRLLRASATAIVLGETQPDDAALVILAQPAIRNAITAAALLDQVKARHAETPWGGSTQSTICRCGASWPCDEAILLGITA